MIEILIQAVLYFLLRWRRFSSLILKLLSSHVPPASPCALPYNYKLLVLLQANKHYAWATWGVSWQCSGPAVANSCTEKEHAIWFASHLRICSECGYTWQERSCLALSAVVFLDLQEPCWTYWKPFISCAVPESGTLASLALCSMGCGEEINLWKAVHVSHPLM